MSFTDALLLFSGGLLAAVVNTMAGGGSLLTVPLLSLAGVEGLLANGTNRVAVLVQSGTAGFGFARRGVGDVAATVRVIIPTLVGGAVGALGVSQIDDELFEKSFGVLMIPMLILALWKPKAERAPKPWPLWLNSLVFFGVGLYAGAVQAGVGLILLLILSRAGFDLVTANAMKSLVIIGVSMIAVVVFIANDQVRWFPALVLSSGTAIGGFLGANIAVEGGENVIRPVLAVAVLALAGRMIGFY